MTPTPSADAVAGIARGLTAGERDWLLSFKPNESAMGGFGSDCGLPGLIERVGISHPIYGPHYRLTPLAIAVRAHLTGAKP